MSDTMTTSAAGTSPSSAGATPTTPRAAAPSATSRRWPRASSSRGARVTIFCAAHAAAPPDETVDGVRFVRRGTKLTRLPRGRLGAAAPRRFGRVDVVVDVQNGLPFFTRAAHPRARSSCWCTTCTASSGRSSTPASPAGSAGGSSAASRRGSTARCQYVAVSRATRDELGRPRRRPRAHRRRPQRHRPGHPGRRRQGGRTR